LIKFLSLASFSLTLSRVVTLHINGCRAGSLKREHLN